MSIKDAQIKDKKISIVLRVFFIDALTFYTLLSEYYKYSAVLTDRQFTRDAVFKACMTHIEFIVVYLLLFGAKHKTKLIKTNYVINTLTLTCVILSLEICSLKVHSIFKFLNILPFKEKF